MNFCSASRNRGKCKKYKNYFSIRHVTSSVLKLLTQGDNYRQQKEYVRNKVNARSKKIQFYRQIFERQKKTSNVKFDQNPSSGSRVVPYGQTDVQPDMTKLIVTLRNSAKAPKAEWKGSERIQLNRHSDKKWAVVNTVMNICVSKVSGDAEQQLACQKGP
jgi:hypothetical protein